MTGDKSQRGIAPMVVGKYRHGSLDAGGHAAGAAHRSHDGSLVRKGAEHRGPHEHQERNECHLWTHAFNSLFQTWLEHPQPNYPILLDREVRGRGDGLLGNIVVHLDCQPIRSRRQ